ncbi:hypothetical protein [Pseudoduganella violaceinigra]|uniref:hypothetical protein n=1 Tax=Pseudoduganella violaceinigra TaxID=246602 RepID=UPI00048503A0|nr:hypothetical protein [Pseudoduganella violaceinigra]
MLVFVVLSTVALLLLMAVGQLFPTKVLLGPTATRQKVTKYYGIPAAVGSICLMVFGPVEKTVPAAAPSTRPTNTIDAERAGEKGRFKAASFQGFTVPGRIADAKATGFTDCKADYYGYKCSRAVPSDLFGIKAVGAALKMDGGDYFADAYLTPVGPDGDVRQLPPEKLAYRDVILTFAISDYDLKCTAKYREKNGGYDLPASCIVNKNTIGHVSQRLKDAGWLGRTSKGGYDRYVHPNELVEITLKNETASINRVSAEHVRELVARENERRAARETADANAAKVLDQMKQ